MGGATEMAALAGPSVGVKPVLITPDQTLLLQLPDQRWRVDDAACAIGAAGQANDLAHLSGTHDFQDRESLMHRVSGHRYLPGIEY